MTKDELRERARDLPRNSSEAELLLWRYLRNRRMMGWKFRRQEVIGPFIVDFMCEKAKLVVEVDGGQHAGQKEYDGKRTAYLEDGGYRVLRFWNNEVLGQLDAVLERIRLALLESPSPRPSPVGEGDSAWDQRRNSSAGAVALLESPSPRPSPGGRGR